MHGWDFRVDSGISGYEPSQRIHKFANTVDAEGRIWVDPTELRNFRHERGLTTSAVDVYDRLWRDPHHGTEEEPYVGEIHDLAANGLTRTGHHGSVAAMGVPRTELPHWEDVQVLTAQLARFPLLDDESVDTSVIIGPWSARPLQLDIPIFVSDMSFGALSQKAKTALASGAEAAGTAICSGEGGVLPEEHAANMARARHHLDTSGPGRAVTLIATGGLRRPADFVKAMALGADALAVSNTALN